MTELLIAALQAEELHAPDPQTVLAGVARGVRRRRRRDAAVPVAVALCVLAASGYTVATHVPPRPGTGAPLALALPTEPPVDAEHPVTFGWLPDGVHPDAQGFSGMAEEGGPYLVASVGPYAWQPSLDQPGWQRIDVNGHPGRLVSRPTRTLVTWQLPSGHWASLEFGRGRPGSANAQPGVEQDARRIADSITEAPDQPPPPVRIALRYLPRGYRIDQVQKSGSSDRLRAVAGTVRLAGTRTGGTEDGITDDDLAFAADGSLNVYLEPADPRMAQFVTGHGWTRVADVQGHAAYSVSRPAGSPLRELVVPDFHGCMLMLLTPANLLEGGGPSLEELVKVAQGVRWTG